VLHEMGAGPAWAGPSPIGPQKVLVIPMNLGSTLAELCPYQTPCPVDPNKDAPYYWWKPPHAAADYYVNGDFYADLKSFGSSRTPRGGRSRPTAPTPTRSALRSDSTTASS